MYHTCSIFRISSAIFPLYYTNFGVLPSNIILYGRRYISNKCVSVKLTTSTSLAPHITTLSNRKHVLKGQNSLYLAAV